MNLVYYLFGTLYIENFLMNHLDPLGELKHSPPPHLLAALREVEGSDKKEGMGNGTHQGCNAYLWGTHLKQFYTVRNEDPLALNGAYLSQYTVYLH